MYEMLTVLILYCQSTLDDRLLMIFDLYKKNEEDETMNIQELRFVLDKFAVITANTLSLRKNIIQEVLKNFMNAGAMPNA